VAAPINLEVLDTPIVEETQFSPDMKRWLSNIVDIVNASFTSIENMIGFLIAVGQTDIGGGGAGPISVTVTGLQANNFVNVTLVSSSNSVTISSVSVSTGSFAVTFSADPGASAIIAYQAFTQQPT
jgi:hypothetical protein